MPTVSRFLSLMIRMYFNNHSPPHIHVVERGGGETIYDLHGKPISSKGKKLSKTKQAVIVAWIHFRQSELKENWRRARAGEDLSYIEPLS